MAVKTNDVRRHGRLIIASLSIALLFAGFTSAYLADGDNSVNKLVIGAVTTEISEDFPSTTIPQPGGETTKVVKITNTGPNDCYVRVQAEFSDSVAESLFELDYNTGKWTFKDGWWYYNDILKSGCTTENLFTKVIRKTSGTGTVSDCDIYVRQESWQSYGYDNCFAPWEKG